MGYDPSDTEFTGDSVRDVHEQLLAYAELGVQRGLGPIVCRVRDASSASNLPSSYPQPGVKSEIGEAQTWFEDMVKIWQAPSRLTSMSFNHGERILGAERPDQLGRVIEALAVDPTSSRGIVTLLEPVTDDITIAPLQFPAFCLVQFHIEDGKVHAIGYFRKQEMRYWWPINVAELRSLQQRVCDGVSKRGRGAIAGEIVTISAIPTFGNTFPRVAITRIDRWVDENPERLLRMALILFDAVPLGAAAAIDDWKTLVEECTPPPDAYGAADGYPVPTSGLETLERTIENLEATQTPSPLATKVKGSLQTARLLTSALTSRQTQGDPARFAALHLQLVKKAAELALEIAEVEQRGGSSQSTLPREESP